MYCIYSGNAAVPQTTSTTTNTSTNAAQVLRDITDRNAKSDPTLIQTMNNL